MSKLLNRIFNAESKPASIWDRAFSGMYIGRKTASGQNVTPQKSMTLSSYYSAIRNISEDVGKLPLRIYKATATGRENVKNSINNIFFNYPNPEMTPMSFKETMTANCLGWGNAYAEIVRDYIGNPIYLYPIHPTCIKVKRNDNNEIYYEFTEQNSTKIINSYDMFHLKGLGGDGIIGYSVYQFASESIGTALSAQEFAGSFFGNGSTLGGVLEYPNKLKPEARDNLRKSWEQRHQGADNAHKIAVLEEGITWKQTSVNPRDAQFLELKKFSVTEIARWFRIPPHKIGDLERSTYSNIEHQSIEYVQDTLTPWLVRWEEEIKRKLIDDDNEFAKFSIQALMRGDSKSRAEYYRSQLNIGALSPNEIRKLEELNSIGAEGDKYYMQLNMTTLDKIGQEENEKSVSMKSAIMPQIKKSVEIANKKEKKAVERALKKENYDLEKFSNEFYIEQEEYLNELLQPVYSVIEEFNNYDLVNKIISVNKNYYNERKNNLKKQILDENLISAYNDAMMESEKNV